MERAIPILPTDDLAAAKAFYVDGLGFRVTFETSADGRTGLLGLQRGSLELTLDCPMDGHGRNACVSLHVADADAYYREEREGDPAAPAEERGVGCAHLRPVGSFWQHAVRRRPVR